jgi:hypothetical protein
MTTGEAVNRKIAQIIVRIPHPMVGNFALDRAAQFRNGIALGFNWRSTGRGFRRSRRGRLGQFGSLFSKLKRVKP